MSLVNATWGGGITSSLVGKEIVDLFIANSIINISLTEPSTPPQVPQVWHTWINTLGDGYLTFGAKITTTTTGQIASCFMQTERKDNQQVVQATGFVIPNTQGVEQWMTLPIFHTQNLRYNLYKMVPTTVFFSPLKHQSLPL